MPAYIPFLKAAGIKWVSGFPDNSKKGLPYISGLLILNDPETGLPIAVMDCVWITGVRTAAATAVAARRLARPDSAVLGVLGCGVQGRTNTEALQVDFPISQVYAYDVDPEAVARFGDDITSRLNLHVTPVASPKEAVVGCDLVERRHTRVRKKVRGSAERPRLCVYRSLHHIYAQVVDDDMGRTLVSASSVSPEFRKEQTYGGNRAAAKLVGRLVAERSKEKGIRRVVFDTAGFCTTAG